MATDPDDGCTATDPDDVQTATDADDVQSATDPDDVQTATDGPGEHRTSNKESWCHTLVNHNYNLDKPVLIC